MSNERCALYNANEIPRPMEILNATLASTKAAREKIHKGEAGQAVMHWFKRDVRVRDNTALSRASALAKEKGVGVVGVWIMSPQDWEAHLVSPAKCDFELRSVALLQKELAELDIPLYMETVISRKNLPQRLLDLAKEWEIKTIFCNLEYEPDELRREERLVRLGAEQGINFEPCHDDCVVPPGSLKTGAGRQYAVYSPWYRAWVAHLHANPHLLDERPMPEKNPPGFVEKFRTIFDCDVPPAPKSKALDAEQTERFSRLWPAGEAAALDRVSLFLTEKVGGYTATRNFPAKKSTASVSVHHAAGTLAARTSVRMARDVNSTKKLDGGIEGVKGWIGEVAWRDFYRHVLVNWPYICMNKPFKFEYTNIEWEYNNKHFRAWTEGRTGTPTYQSLILPASDPDRLPNRRRRNALPQLHRLHAQPPPHDHRLVPRQAPPPRLAPRRAVLHDAPDRRRFRVQQRRLGLFLLHGRRSAAVLPRVQPVAAEREVRRRRRIHPGVGAGAEAHRGGGGAQSVRQGRGRREDCEEGGIPEGRCGAQVCEG
ncbi:hypothetical protein PMIN02_008068 [Paraphaeosphaeria minitans]